MLLRNDARIGDLLIIDEPELNLHPKTQRAVVRVLAKAVNRGLKIILSTHSDFVVRELSQLVMLSSERKTVRDAAETIGVSQESALSADKLGVYIVGAGDVRPVPVSERGFGAETLEDEIVRVNRDGARPDLLRADACMVDRRLSMHARRLRRVRVELRALDDPHAFGAPIVLTVHARRTRAR